jgi:Phage tail assembly chaperone proteins, E, or 41 or 14
MVEVNPQVPLDGQVIEPQAQEPQPQQATNGQPQARPDKPAQEPPRMVNGKPVWDGRLVLRKQVINGDGEPVMEITFREPTAGDIERVGNPVLVGMYENTPKIHFDTTIMTQMMARLAACPPSTIRSMHPKDWNNGAWLLADFFMPDL